MSSLRESIITSAAAEKALNRVSPIYDESYVGLWLFEVIGREYDALNTAADTLADQFFPETASWAIELWEQRYGLITDTGLTMDERRRRIITARSIPKPFIPANIESHILGMTGRSTETDENIGPYTFAIYIVGKEGMTVSDFNAITAYIRRHKPSHMSYELYFQSDAQAKISIETGYWRFYYSLTDGAPAGTLPEYNITAGLESAAIEAAVEEAGSTFTYYPCGITPAGGAAI